MRISFSSSDRYYAEQHFKSNKWDWLNREAKDYVLQHCGKDLRVQCPMMYENPQLEITNKDHYHAIMALYKPCTTPTPKDTAE